MNNKVEDLEHGSPNEQYRQLKKRLDRASFDFRFMRTWLVGVTALALVEFLVLTVILSGVSS